MKKLKNCYEDFESSSLLIPESNERIMNIFYAFQFMTLTRFIQETRLLELIPLIPLIQLVEINE